MPFALNFRAKKRLNYQGFTNAKPGPDGTMVKTMLLPAIPERTFWMMRTLRNLFAKSNSELIAKAVDALAEKHGIDPESIAHPQSPKAQLASLKDLSTDNLQALLSKPKSIEKNITWKPASRKVFKGNILEGKETEEKEMEGKETERRETGKLETGKSGNIQAQQTPECDLPKLNQVKSNECQNGPIESPNLALQSEGVDNQSNCKEDNLT